ncbi:MAG: hypothetical protein ACK5BN_19980, partial [Planctomycetota bacterium]
GDRASNSPTMLDVMFWRSNNNSSNTADNNSTAAHLGLCGLLNHGWRAQDERRHCAVDAAANELLCPHRPTRRGEVAFAVLEDGAIGFDDVLRRRVDDGIPCQLPGCVAAAHAAYVRVMGGGEADDLAHAMAAFRAAP